MFSFKSARQTRSDSPVLGLVGVGKTGTIPLAQIQYTSKRTYSKPAVCSLRCQLNLPKTKRATYDVGPYKSALFYASQYTSSTHFSSDIVYVCI
jgi:hypothetical protein